MHTKLPRRNSQIACAFSKQVFTILSLTLMLPAPSLAQDPISRISVAENGSQLSTFSGNPSLSPDGNFAVFVTADSTLFSGDTAGTLDYVHVNLTTGELKPVTLNFNHGFPNPTTFLQPMASVSSNGRFVAFVSDVSASSSVFNIPNASDVNGTFDVFVRDMQSGDYELISVDVFSATPNTGNGASNFPRITPDGRYVVFESNANDLVANDSNGFTDVFVYDRQDKKMERISLASDGTQGNNNSVNASVSDDGQTVTFESSATNLVANDNNGFQDVFVRMRDPFQPQTELVSVDSSTPPVQANAHSFSGLISGDGRFVAFNSRASNLVGADTANTPDIMVRDLQNNTTSSFSVNNTTYIVDDGGFGNNAFPAISQDGRMVAFTGIASTGTNIFAQIYFVERNLSTGAAVSSKPLSNSAVNVSQLGNGNSHNAVISADGSTVVFESAASDLVTGDSNTVVDVFRADARDPVTPSVTISATVENAAEPTTNGEFTVTLNEAPLSNLTVSYTVSGTATADTDYTALSGTLTINAGETSATLAVAVIDDTVVESAETVIVTIDGGTGYTVGNPASATVTIADDEVPPVDPTITSIQNISTNGPIDARGMIAGFIVEAAGRYVILAEGEGPSPISDPVLNLTGQFLQNGQLQTLPPQSNDNWNNANSAELQQVIGRLPNSANAAAILIDLQAGIYTATITGKNSQTGTGIIAVNQSLASNATPHLRNISTNGPIDARGMIAGFILTDPGRYAILAEGEGPSPITDPVLNLTGQFVENGQIQTLPPQSNDNWNSANSAELQQIIGRLPNSANAAAILIDLQPGIYSATITGKNGATGTGIIAVNQARPATP